MIDLQLPRPLLVPPKWPAGDAMMSIFSLQWGGAFAARRCTSFVAPDNFWAHEAEPSFVAVLNALPKSSDLEIISRVALSASEQDQWRQVGAKRFKVEAALRLPSLLEWSREVFPRAFAEAGEMAWLRELREYEAQLPMQTPSLSALRFLPAFLRSRKNAVAEVAGVEWARVQALFSPQDDRRSSGDIVYLNPTLQVIETRSGLHGIWRADGELSEAFLAWQEAAVIDELRETPRLPRAALLGELDSRSYSLPPTQSTFDAVIADLVGRGLLLMRS